MGPSKTGPTKSGTIWPLSILKVKEFKLVPFNIQFCHRLASNADDDDEEKEEENGGHQQRTNSVGSTKKPMSLPVSLVVCFPCVPSQLLFFCVFQLFFNFPYVPYLYFFRFFIET
jgi:hypothetical protein